MNLFDAIQKGFYFEVEKCIKRGEPLHMVDIAGFSPLHWAAIKGHALIIELLVKNGAQVNKEGTQAKVTPLHMAALANKKEAVEKLITLGATIDAKNSYGDTALDITLKVNQNSDWIGFQERYSPELIIADKIDSDFDTIASLLAFGAHLSDLSQLTDFVIKAISLDKVEGLKQALGRGFDLKSLNDTESTLCGYDYAAIVAASNYSIDCLKFLHERIPGLFSAAKGSFGEEFNTGFFCWITQQMPSLKTVMAPFEFIDEQRNHLERDNFIPLLPSALKNCEPNYRFNPTTSHYYISKIESGVFLTYFDQHGQVKNLDSVLNKMKLTLDYLKDQGIDLNHRDYLRETPSKYLALCHSYFLKPFIEAGVTFNSLDLHNAICHNSAEAVKLMIQSGANVSWKNHEGKSALNILNETTNPLILNHTFELMTLINQKALEEVTQKLDKIQIEDSPEDFISLIFRFAATKPVDNQREPHEIRLTHRPSG